MNLDTIWDEPIAAVHTAPPNAPEDSDHNEDEVLTRPAKRRRSASLFLGGDDSDIDAMFEDLDDIASGSNVAASNNSADVVNDDDMNGGFAELAPALDTRNLRRQADARNTVMAASSSQLPRVPIMPSSSPARDNGEDGDGKTTSEAAGKKRKKGDPKPKKPILKLDEERLLGPAGFPALIKDIKSFKSRGKGNEAADLNQLLGIYHFWAHRMYPKMQFKETVQRIEKLCHSRRMHVTLGVWRDEVHGIGNGKKRGDGEEDQPRSDNEPTGDQTSDVDDNMNSGDDQDAGDPPERRRIHALSSSPPSPHPPSSSAQAGDPEFDNDFIDEMLRQEAGANSVTPPTSALRPSVAKVASDFDFDDTWDDAFLRDALVAETGPSNPPPTSASSTSLRRSGEDEDMLELMRERDADDNRTRAISISRRSSDLFIPDPDEDEDVLEMMRERDEGSMPVNGSTAPSATALVVDKPLANGALEADDDDEWGDMYLDQ